jgi:hypothetical protein
MLYYSSSGRSSGKEKNVGYLACKIGDMPSARMVTLQSPADAPLLRDVL